MAFTDRWTLLQLRTSARRVLADPAGRFWSDAELNNYIDEWQSNLQDQFEFAWNTATITTSLSTHTITNIATDIMRLDAVYWNEWRLNGRTKQNLDDIVREEKLARSQGTQSSTDSTLSTQTTQSIQSSITAVSEIVQQPV